MEAQPLLTQTVDDAFKRLIELACDQERIRRLHKVTPRCQKEEERKIKLSAFPRRTIQDVNEGDLHEQRNRVLGIKIPRYQEEEERKDRRTAFPARTTQDVNKELDDYKRKIKSLEEELTILKKEKEVLKNIKDKAPDLALSKNLKELFQSGYEGDVTVKVGEKEFLVHKAILATRSSVFRTMFETNMVEKKDGVVNIEDCEPDHFENFLLFMYSGQFDIVKPSNALNLCLIADKYNVMQLKEACFEVMKKEMSIESICNAVYLASLYNKQDLLDIATEYFAENMYKIVCTPMWLSFLKEHTVIGNELLIKSAKKTKQ